MSIEDEITEDFKKYLEKYEISSIFKELMEKLVITRPDDPIAFMIDELQVMKSTIALNSDSNKYSLNNLVNLEEYVQIVVDGSSRKVIDFDKDQLYGRLDRVVIQEGRRLFPQLLTSRPTKSVDFEMPLSFVMGPSLLSNIPSSPSLEHFLANVIGLEEATIKQRLELIQQGNLDHVLMIFSSRSIPVQQATISGLEILLRQIHSAAADRFSKVSLYFEELSGPDNFQKRLDKYSSMWDTWFTCSNCMWLGTHTDYPSCGCRHASFDSYCVIFDEVYDENNIEDAALVSREMMYLMLSCNKYFGMDGFVYDNVGKRVGPEYLAINVPINSLDEYENPIVTKVFLSEIDRFNVV